MSGIGEFDFNAPTYYNYKASDDDKEADKYFDVDHEEIHSMDKTRCSLISASDIKQEIITPEDKKPSERLVKRAHRRLSSLAPLSIEIKNEEKEELLNNDLPHEPEPTHSFPPTEKVYHFTAPSTSKSAQKSPNRKKPYKVVTVPVLEYTKEGYVECQKEIHFEGIKTQQFPKRYTEPKPFSFEARHKQMLKKKEDKIREYLEEEKRARNFHANPLPAFVAPKKLNDVSTASHYTIPDPPKLKTVERHLHRNEKEANKTVETAKTFKAQPADVLYKKPFEPKKPGRQLQDITDIELNTQRRAKEREQFDLKMKEKELMMLEKKRELELEQKRREEEEIAKLRKCATHKANPVPHFKPLEFKKSEKPLTEPYSPRVTKRRKISHKL